MIFNFQFYIKQKIGSWSLEGVSCPNPSKIRLHWIHLSHVVGQENFLLPWYPHDYFVILIIPGTENRI